MELENAFFDTTDFEKTNKIGEGKFGKVYIVRNENDDKEYAAKIIKTNGVFNGRQQMLLMREAIILRKLSHPSIVKFYGINFHSFDDPSKLEPTIITEYLSNGSLKVILDNEKLSMANDGWTATKKYISLLGISHALKYMHRHGIVHRDLKPENILIDDDFYPRICDFGLSRCFDENLSKSIQLVMTKQIGTPLYMAPELFMDDQDPQYVSSIDVYAFAMLAYEIVTGIVPFCESNKKLSLSSLIQKVISGERPEFNEFATDKMQDLISRCWSNDPKERPSFDEIFDRLSKDLTYFDEDVDEEEVSSFIDILNDVKDEQKDNEKAIIDKLEKENEQLKKKTLDLEEENEQLKKKALTLEEENEQLKKKTLGLEEENEKIKKKALGLEEEILKQAKDDNSSLSYDDVLNKYKKLENILEDQEAFQLLHNFSEKRLCQEYTLFYIEYKEYKKITDHATRYKKFIDMCNRYVKDDAPFHINLQLSVLKKVEHTQEADLSENVFDEMVNKVKYCIHSEILPPFERSTEFKQFIERKVNSSKSLNKKKTESKKKSIFQRNKK